MGVMNDDVINSLTSPKKMILAPSVWVNPLNTEMDNKTNWKKKKKKKKSY